MVLRHGEFERIERYVSGSAADSDREFVESLLAEGGANSYLRRCMEKDWDSTAGQSDSSEADLARLLDRIYHRIRKGESETTMRPLQKVLRIYMKTAAVLLIPLMIAGVLLNKYLPGRQKLMENESTTARIFAPMGSRVSFSLPDGTKGMLNSGSHLEYATPFISDRKVKLEGEAWFEVKRDEKHPFLIAAGSSVVKVLGTDLNVSAYSDENYIEVVLNSGKIEYLSGLSKERIILMPSERLVCHKGRIGKSKVDPEKYNAWTGGRLIFRGDPMAEVARRIERWYNVRIVVADRELEKYSFRATFQDDSLENVLTFLAMTSPIRYEISPKKSLPDGTIEKQQITIYRKK